MMDKSAFIDRFQRVSVPPDHEDYPLKVPGRPAAVLMPIIERDELTMLFTTRAAHLKHHAGQVSFPGGRKEDSDLNLQETALRETEEEIGLASSNVSIIGSLKPYRTISRYEMTPYIGFVSTPFSLTLDKNEVSHHFEVPLNYLLDLDNHFLHVVERGGERHTITFIPWQDQYIWGATAAIIRNLALHLKDNF